MLSLVHHSSCLISNRFPLPNLKAMKACSVMLGVTCLASLLLSELRAGSRHPRLPSRWSVEDRMPEKSCRTVQVSPSGLGTARQGGKQEKPFVKVGQRKQALGRIQGHLNPAQDSLTRLGGSHSHQPKWKNRTDTLVRLQLDFHFQEMKANLYFCIGLVYTCPNQCNSLKLETTHAHE